MQRNIMRYLMCDKFKDVKTFDKTDAQCSIASATAIVKCCKQCRTTVSSTRDSFFVAPTPRYDEEAEK